MDATMARSTAHMFIAHIPASYLLAKVTAKKHLSLPSLAALSLGSIFPDIDLLRFYLLDNHQIHHHHYWTHRPFVWACIVLAFTLMAKLAKRKLPAPLWLFFMSVFLHLALDTIVGDIGWSWPIYDRSWTLVTIQDTHTIWILNFFLHWTFAVEIVICLMASLVFIRQEGRKYWR